MPEVGHDGGAPADASSGPDTTDAGDEPDIRDAAHCNGSPLRAYDESPGVLNQVWVDLPSGSTTAPFVVDMGSPISYWALPPLPDGGDGGIEITFDGGTTMISCAMKTLPTLRGVTLGDDPKGGPAAGALGVDLVKNGAALDLQIADSRFVWWDAPPTPPEGATSVPLALHTSRGAYNVLVASGIQLDGRDVRLILDTGSPHVVLVSTTPRPGETSIPGEDGNGESLTLYESTAQIAFGGGPGHTVTVDRAASFPTLQRTMAALGEDVVGLLGINALGHRRIVITSEELMFVQ